MIARGAGLLLSYFVEALWGVQIMARKVALWLVLLPTYEAGAGRVLAVPGEDCATAQAITLPHSENFNNTSSLPGMPSPTCNSSGQSALQNDVWYSVMTDAICRKLVIEVDALAQYTELISAYAGSACATMTQVGCTIRQDISDPVVLSVNVAPLTPYMIQVGNWGSSSDGGLSSFHAFCPVCGNSIVETTEQCDDGNLIDGDGCQSNCVVTPPVNDACESALPIGDGLTAFDLTGSVGGPGVDCGTFIRSFALDIWYDYVVTCDGALVINTCGGSVGVANITAYDSGDCPVEFTELLSCSLATGCSGNEHEHEVVASVFAGQLVKVRVGRNAAFSSGVGPPDVLNVSCVPTVCGNSVVELAEGCDDGNQADDDGCDSNCTPTACGNRVVTTGEQCDDGNTLSGDNCSRTCQVEGPCPCVTSRDCRNSLCDFNNACNCNQCVNGFCEWSCVRYGNIDCLGAVTLDDLLESLVSFSGNSQLNNADISPCEGNGIINIDDILALLSAFGGANPCGCDPSGTPSICGSVTP